MPPVPSPEEPMHVYKLPYDATTGLRRIPGSNSRAPPTPTLLTLDLTLGKRVCITAGKYAGSMGEVVGMSCEGHYKIKFQIQLRSGFLVPFELVLGKWWPEQAMHGSIGRLPVVPATEDLLRTATVAMPVPSTIDKPTAADIPIL